MIHRHADIVSVLRDRPLGPADREYLQAAITVVPPRRAHEQQSRRYAPVGDIGAASSERCGLLL